MKKLMLLIAVSLIFQPIAANAERIVILDENNNIKQEIYTMPMNTQVVTSQQTVVSQPQTVSVQPQTVYVQPQTVYVQQPRQEVVVVRQTSRPRTYYYDSAATSLLAGFTGAVIGNAIFGGHHHGGHHHGGHHHGGHHHH